MVRPLRLSAVAGALALAVTLPLMFLGYGSAHAYGNADQPLAQIEFSGNCNNPDFPFCAQPPDGVGTGGIWFWIEIDANGTGDIAGAECFHTVGGVGGPWGAGAQSVRGDISWEYSDGANLPADILLFGQDPGDQYYVVTLDSGDVFAFPVTQGHYSVAPVPGVSIQTTIAP